MYYVGIDQSLTSTGICIISKKSGLLELKTVSSKALVKGADYFEDDRASVYLGTDKRVQGLILRIEQVISSITGNSFGGEVMVGLEQMAFATAPTLGLQLLFQYLILRSQSWGKYNTWIFTPQEVKMFATGEGNARKVDIIREASVVMPNRTWKAKDEDLADSLAIATALEWIHMKSTHFNWVSSDEVKNHVTQQVVLNQKGKPPKKRKRY